MAGPITEAKVTDATGTGTFRITVPGVRLSRHGGEGYGWDGHRDASHHCAGRAPVSRGGPVSGGDVVWKATNTSDKKIQ